MRVTVATDGRGRPLIQTSAAGSCSTLRTQSLSARTVETHTVSPDRQPSSGTRRRCPERRPVVSTTKMPGPCTDVPNPRRTAGSTMRLSVRKNWRVGAISAGIAEHSVDDGDIAGLRGRFG